jgi:steroid delta-isomerase-like uncharacterized protein
MSVEENKALVHRYLEEVYNKKNVAAIDELIAPNLIAHAYGPPADREGYKQVLSMLFTAFPDYHLTVEDMVAEGDKVAVRFTWSGTHKGEFTGLAPTGKQVTVTAMTIHRVEDGKVVETWGLVDRLGQMQQLGVVPSPGQPGK